MESNSNMMPPGNLSSTGDLLLFAWEDVVIKKREPRHPVRPEVIHSWRRCLKLGIDPFATSSQPRLSEEELARLRNQNRSFIDAAMPVIKMIEISVRGSGFVITLTEKNGIVLEVIGDEDIIAMAHNNFYMPGCSRSTESAGTNGLGLALDEKKPLQLTGAEHYNKNFHAWTCSSAPIYGNEHEIIGLITLSGRSTGKHKHTLALVTAAANIIEMYFREKILIERQRRLNSILTSIYDSVPYGFIAIDKSRKITHINNAARHMIGMISEAPMNHLFEEIIETDEQLIKKIDAGEHFSHKEIKFSTPHSSKAYMCNSNPINDGPYQLMGTIITVTDRKEMISIAKNVGGNYAKYEFEDLKGHNAELTRQINLAKIASKTNSRIMVIGESGTGKELFAQAIHSHSNRNKGPFVAISCAAIPRDLIESELFGYVGGAFTGARQKGMVGKFELANKGTLFLDEIDGLPLDLQAKLLRVLQQNEIMRLGDTRTMQIDVRIISATNKDLLDEVEAGNFREDLYYRLNVVEIVIPPLRERIDDLELLMHHIKSRQCLEMGIPHPTISEEALEILKSYDWPGNIRELENTIERAILLSQGGTITKEHLPTRTRKRLDTIVINTKSLRQNSYENIKATLDQCEGNISEAARRLMISRSTLYRKMRELQLK